MGLEDFIPAESPESWWNSAEISEKYKEAAKKAGAWIKRTQKDEKKAKRYDFLLAKYLVEMILKKKYDSILEELFSCLDTGYGANFLLWILSLIYLPISHEIRKFEWKEEISFSYIPSAEIGSFDESNIPEEIRLRVNAWIEDMESVMRMEASTIVTKRTLGLILYDEKIRDFSSKVFSYFFLELNIKISREKSRSYSDFILWELQKSTKNILPDMMSRDKWEQGEI